MKKFLFLFFIICCSQLSAQIEFTNDGEKPLLIYESSNFDDVVKEISKRLNIKATKEVKTEKSSNSNDVIHIAKWLIDEKNNYKIELVAKKYFITSNISGDKRESFSLSIDHSMPIKKYMFNEAYKTFKDLKQDIIKEMGDPHNCNSTGFFDEICMWITNKCQHFLQIYEKDGYWIINNTEWSSK